MGTRTEVITKRSSPKAGRRVLIAHEDASTCMVVRQALEAELHVSVVMEAYDFLEWISEYRFAVAVCDLVGERIKGLEVLGLVARVSPELARRVVFLVPADADAGLYAFLRSVGNPWVRSPVLPSELQQVVRSIATQSIRP